MEQSRKLICLLGVKIDVVTAADLIKDIHQLIETKTRSAVFYVNPDCLNKAYIDDDYRSILNAADLVYADGVGVVIAARLARQYLPDRITAIDIFHDLCHTWAQQGIQLFLLGSNDKSNELACSRLQAAHPQLKIVGHHHGYFHWDSDLNQRVIEQINCSEPDVLLVGFGAPHQEKWIAKHMDQLNVRLCWGVGGLFDLLSGNLKRGPALFHQHHLEWFCRLMITPGKVWKRYLIGGPQFFMRVILFEHLNRTKRAKKLGVI
ncbi:MAG: WecB/TagA/CpsF family glycosyltransferase [candidate division KSB1 bacterium]|nr:WecB/TagA/CpsF family glycosyltransferase [candidate division KSB1 bacterium]MDZ7358212.1 WecB/TagA/CpsF family glycosyltransferase [candidate division KSB1 bacterium]MDZ7399648.1 WecB/TagA/CpsF family glycosyltransferase [candidate division KSB1 bacterium]